MTQVIPAFVEEHAFLSNFYPATVTWEGLAYPTVEHAFQAAKSLDPKERARIARCSSPGKAKAAGRRVELRRDWEHVKLGVMAALVREKFAVHPELAERLLATGEARLLEGNTWGDTFWGVVRGHGKNHLGRILMRVRAELRAEDEVSARPSPTGR